MVNRNDLAEYIEDNHLNLVTFVRKKLAETAARDSEDIVQEVLLSILDGPGITDPIVNLSAYVFRALRNRIIDEYRKPRKAVRSMDEPGPGELTLKEVIPDLQYEPVNSYRKENLLEDIRKAIDSLPARQREVILATEFRDMSIKDLARETGTPEGTLLARKHRGLKTIQMKFRHIKEEYHGGS